jgi:CubicO group peptidase (beta-lactamase class C family)
MRLIRRCSVFSPPPSRVVSALVMAAMATGVRPALAQDRPGGEGAGPPAVPLHMAALQGDLEAVRQHVAAGSDLDQVDAYGSTPLIVAVTFGRTEAARALVEAGADPAIGNPEGSTALHLAAFFGRTEIADILLAHGADPHLRNDDGAIAFDLAAEPVEGDRPLLDRLGTGLAPLGLTLDYDRIAAARPVIAERLRPDAGALDAVDFGPRPDGDWPVSTPEAEGLDPALLAELYYHADRLETIYGLLVVRNGRLIAERYFNEGALERPALLQSVTKSVTSALVGIAVDRGCLESLDRRMVEFFPELADGITDPRKQSITVREMLQMRAGYPWEESDSAYWAALISGDYLPLVAGFPLARDPGTGFEYSNITSHLLGVIVARSCDTDLLDFANAHLFGPIGIAPGFWRADPYGYRYGQAELNLTARDAARFGLLYLNRGTHDGRQLLPAAWVDESLSPASMDIDNAGVVGGNVGRYFREVGYGYQWWSARVGDRRFAYAWGHGGQLVVLLDDLDMVVVVTSDPFHLQHDDEEWTHEQANLNLVGRFIRSLPAPPR